MIAPFSTQRKKEDNNDTEDDDLSLNSDLENEDLSDIVDGKDFELDGDREAADDLTIEEIIQEIEEEWSQTPEEHWLGRQAVTKVCTLYIKVCIY